MNQGVQEGFTDLSSKEILDGVSDHIMVSGSGAANTFSMVRRKGGDFCSPQGKHVNRERREVLMYFLLINYP